MLSGLSASTDIVELLRKVSSVTYKTGWTSTSLAKDVAAEIIRLRQALSEAEKREKDARADAIIEAAKTAVLTANHLTILPPSVRKFPEVGGIIAAKILALEPSIELVKSVDNQPVDNMEGGET
jgi:hypothetical protein